MPRFVASTGLRLIAVVAISASVAPMPPVPLLPVQSPEAFRRLPDGPRITVPATVDATGAIDASGRLRDFLAGVPDGSTISFEAGGIYRLDHAIRVDGRSRLVFDGNGATLRIDGCEIDDSGFVIDHRATSITVREFTIVGDNAAAGTSGAFHPGCESQSGVAVYSGRDVEVADMTISDTHGDCLYIDAGGPEYIWADNVWFHDSSCARIGRMGVAISAANRVMVERVRFDRIGMFVLDIEPYTSLGGGTNVTFQDNVVSTYGLTPLYTNWFVAAQGEPGSNVSDLTVTRNKVLSGAPRGPNTITLAGLATTIRTERRQRIVFTDNSTTVAGKGPALYFSHIDGLTVTGNVQPLTGGSVARFSDCTGVRYGD